MILSMMLYFRGTLKSSLRRKNALQITTAIANSLEIIPSTRYIMESGVTTDIIGVLAAAAIRFADMISQAISS